MPEQLSLHDQLTVRAVRWLQNSRRCVFILVEPLCPAGSEIPDAIGWTYRGRSIVVECKASLPDFYSDRRKPPRQKFGGLGTLRYYMTKPGLLRAQKLPTYWGLLEVHPKQVRTITQAEVPPWRRYVPTSVIWEMGMLASYREHGRKAWVNDAGELKIERATPR